MAGLTATAIAVSSLAGAGLSFAQAAKQSELQKKAEAAANAAMEEAKKRLDVNFYDQLGINKSIYEKEREASLAQGSQAIQAAMESGEGAAATAGRVYMGQQEAQADITKRQNEEMQRLQELAAQGDAAAAEAMAKLYLGEVEGAQQAAAYSEQAKNLAMQRGVTALGQGFVDFAGQRELYGQTKQPAQQQTQYAPPVSSQRVFGAQGIPYANQQKITPVGQSWKTAFGF